MPRKLSYYPPGPEEVPPNLTAPSAKFRLQVVALLLSLALFLLIYLGLLVISGWAFYWSITASFGSFILIKLLCIVWSGLLFLYLFKGLFKRPRVEKSLHLEITASEHPHLFSFIGQVCDDTQATRPHRVIVSPEVNAAVFYHESLLSLVLPAPKNLLVGLGLVNMINLSEFKAVLAHEFGHFTQKSMKLQAYVYRANRIIIGIVFGRDWFDDLLFRLKYLRIWLAWPIWLLIGGLWLIRNLLGLLFQFMNVLNSGLSFQMEYHADLVSVGVAGSLAAIHLLAKTVIASECWDQGLSDLRAAANHHLYTRDLFFHQNHAAPYLRKLKRDAQWGEIPESATDPEESGYVFTPECQNLPLMWATHPTNYEREQNARRHFVACPLDERSPWILFGDPRRLREKVTRRFYRIAWRLPKSTVPSDPQTVQEFIDDEHAQSTYGECYHGIYDRRGSSLNDLPRLVVKAGLKKPNLEDLAVQHSQLYELDLKARASEHQVRLKEQEELWAFHEKTGKAKRDRLEFRGRSYPIKDANRLLKKVEKELKEDTKWLNDFDERVFLVHYQLARTLGPKVTEDLMGRYQLYVKLQQFGNQLGIHQARLNGVLGLLATRREFSAEEYFSIHEVFQKAHSCLADILRESRLLVMPAIGAFKKGEYLGPHLLDKPLIYQLIGEASDLTAKWINRLMEQIAEVLDKVERLRAKSWGAVLTLQEEISRTSLKKLVAPIQPSPS